MREKRIRGGDSQSEGMVRGTSCLVNLRKDKLGGCIRYATCCTADPSFGLCIYITQSHFDVFLLDYSTL